MKNKITSLILVAAIALMANIAGMANTAGNSNGSDELLLCFEEPNFAEF